MSDARANTSSIAAVRYRGRLAPSPTGAQHVGNARTYLISWLAARAAGGQILLRIEDIDSPRIKPGAAAQVRDELSWLGLDWDEQPTVQSDRLALYEAALKLLQDRDLVYPCTCTRTDVESAASAPTPNMKPHRTQARVLPAGRRTQENSPADRIRGAFARSPALSNIETAFVVPRTSSRAQWEGTL